MSKKLEINKAKEDYLDRISRQTSYPVLRGLISMFAYLLYGLSLLSLVMGIIGAFSMEGLSVGLGVFILVSGFIMSALFYVLGRIIKELLTILIDIADSILDLNSRYG